MKKLFISCPMKGRTEENIKKTMERLHKMAEIVFDQELEVIKSYNPCTVPVNCNSSIFYLGKSIAYLSEADYFIGVYTDYYSGCRIEFDIARRYGIPNYGVDLEIIAPDAYENEIANSKVLISNY